MLEFALTQAVKQTMQNTIIRQQNGNLSSWQSICWTGYWLSGLSTALGISLLTAVLELIYADALQQSSHLRSLPTSVAVAIPDASKVFFIPEAMMYACQQTQGLLQGRNLAVAVRLASIELDEHFYECSHKFGTYGTVSRVEWTFHKQLCQRS
ncbi:hypothetical protein CC79DRAFT_172516 [Sarocladium strictum]